MQKFTTDEMKALEQYMNDNFPEEIPTGKITRNKIDQALSTAEKTKLPFTQSGYIQTVKDVHSALEYYFTKSQEKDAQLSGRNPIHHYMFFCHLIDEDPIQRPEEYFVTLKGITKRYQMCVKKEGTIDWRMRSCWCMGCMSSLYNGTPEWGQTHVVESCVAVSET